MERTKGERESEKKAGIDEMRNATEDKGKVAIGAVERRGIGGDKQSDESVVYGD